jgi:hypothetical protein
MFSPFGMPMHTLEYMNKDKIKMIGPLTEEERKIKLEKYLDKKKNRKWKIVKYTIRKSLADQR